MSLCNKIHNIIKTCKFEDRCEKKKKKGILLVVESVLNKSITLRSIFNKIYYKSRVKYFRTNINYTDIKIQMKKYLL